MDSQHVKSLSTDSRSKNRIRYASSRQKAKGASADVYRNYKRKIGVTSAATREERVHSPTRQDSKRAKKRVKTSQFGDSSDKQAVVPGRATTAKELELDTSGSESDGEKSASNFASELDIALDRNASEIFSFFHREIWYLVRSLPEVLHHAPKIVDLMLAYMLSPETAPSQKSSLEEETDDRVHYIVNHATTDILHLLAVLARDLRHEIHPFLHSKIIPRIVNDLLNPPPPLPGSGKQPIPIAVPCVEVAFRTLSYIFRYDAEVLLKEVDKPGQEPCLEPMRKYYGVTLAHRRDLIRRLAAETFAPLIRKLPTDSAKKRHLRRVLRALAVSAKQPATSVSSQRMQTDAVDGISMLCFEVSRGVARRLHSKGSLVVKCVLDSVMSGKSEFSAHGQGLVHDVASAFFSKVCFHLDAFHAAAVLIDVVGALKRLVASQEKGGTNESDVGDTLSSAQAVSLVHSLQLVNQMVNNRSGALLRQKDQSVPELSALFEMLLEGDQFQKLPFKAQSATVDVLCSTWKAIPANARFASRMGDLIRDVAQSASATTEPDSEDAESIRAPVFILVEDLFPYLPIETAMTTVGRAILSTAARIADEDSELAMTLVHAVSSRRTKALDADIADDDVDEDDDDAVFFLENAGCCQISDSERERLLDACLVDIESVDLTETVIPQLGVAAKCASFLALVPGDKTEGKSFTSLFKKVSKWLLRLLKLLGDANSSVSDSSQSTSLSVVFSLVLESFSRLSLASFDKLEDSAIVKNALVKARPVAERHLLSRATSLWAVKSVAAFVDALQKTDLLLNDNADVVFEALIVNLRDAYHFRRLHTLRILSHYPQRPFVTDYADLDLAGDLDEEPSTDQGRGPTADALGPSGPCDIVQTLLDIESSPVTMSKERYLLSLVSRVEVLGRTGKLPVVYAEAAASHMLGLLHVKFGPMWPVAVRSLIALTKGHEDSVWPAVQEKVAELMQSSRDASESEVTVDNGSGAALDPLCYVRLCMAWETSSGSDTSLFHGAVTAAKEHGRISRHQSTDEATVLQSVWSVIEGAPDLLMRHSRVMVPIFLRFMISQYYVAHPNDADARELQLQEHVTFDKGVSTSGGIDRRTVQQRLTSILQAFANVNGPQQLYKHQLLLSIFVSLIGHQETTIAQLAFSCVLRYKPAHLVPYADPLQNFFGKGKLREAMLQFKTLWESGDISPEHRGLLMPVLSRMLFGRLSARSSGAKSSKDTPAARRIAVLSFLAGLCESDDDLYSFIYLTVRSYVPLQVPMKAVELHDSEDRRELHEIIAALHPEQCARLPIQVHQGFLNMLEAVVSQLGHRVLSFVPSFMSSVLALCKVYGVKEDLGKEDGGTLTRQEGVDVEDGDDGAVDGGRSGSVRTLCYRRMADLFSQFSAVFDFREYSAQLWGAVGPSLELLPAMVVKSDKSPALLLLLQTLSSTSQLVPILEQSDEAIRAVLMCISDTSRGAVIDSTLTFVDNLLMDDWKALASSDFPESQPTAGGELIRRHLGLLLGQLKIRLDSTCSLVATRPVAGSWKKDSSASFTWRRELDILCRVSTLIDTGKLGGQQVAVEVMESLCTMLIPFLEMFKCTDTDRLNILGVLDAMIPKLPSETLVSYYSKLSGLLGPKKAKPGIISKEVRRSLASVFETLSGAGFPSSGRATGILVELCTVEAKRVDEVDYDAVVPALSKLGDSNSDQHWLGLCQDEGGSNPTILLPLINSLFHFLFDEDGVISRGAFKAIKDLVGLAAAQLGLGPEGSPGTALDSTQEKWKRLLEGCLVPMTRSGLASRDASIRRYFILILGEVAKWNKNSDSPHLYGDLARLIRDDDPELDFFLNITHVQLHRRSRALQRLRTLLNAESDLSVDARFSQHSLSNVFLKLALHPVYESKTKLEEAFALEAIATVGAISRLLPWSKYNSILWTTLTQFERHPTQERYLIGLICAIIDGFHFEVSIPTVEGDAADNGGSNSVWRALEKRLVPKVESLLVKEKADRGGSKVKILRPAVIMALLKLFKKLPEHIFVSRLPRLMAVICDGLKNRDSDARDMARTTLAKMAVELDIAFLPDIVRELAVTLTEGYQLHVRAAAIHSILLQLSAVYKPPILSFEQGGLPLPFDKTVPALMDLIQQDLFGEAQERKEAENSVRYVKEASGSKSSNSIEIIASMILFNPSKANGKSGVSAIHAIVSPLLERLRSPGTKAKAISRIKECLSRVVNGLFRNPSLEADEVLPFVYATVEPFVSKQEVDSVVDRTVDPEDSDDEDPLDPIDISGGVKSAPSDSDAQKEVAGTVTVWRPSTLKSSKTNKAAHLAKSKAERGAKIARDGASAPKLTGSSRYASPKVSTKVGVNDPANISAVVFGLQLLHSSLKKIGQRDSDKMVAMLDPFVPLLTTCTCLCRDSDVVLLALRCLGSLLRVELPSFSLCSKSLATKTLDVLASSGAVSNINQELLHASFKMLTFLINFDLRHQGGKNMPGETAEAGEHALAKGNVIPLDAEQMQVLISFLRGSLTDSDHHNPAIGLVKALVYRRFMSPEFYDLIETILTQSVRSPRESLRQLSGGIFVSYLLNYPMSEERLEQHLKQIVLNIKYEHAEGRLSAVSLMATVIEKLPSPVLQKHCQMFFLPLTLQLANDDSKECREAIAKCLSKLLERLSTDMLQSLYDYIERWSQGDGALRRTSLQLYGIFLESRVDFMKRGDTATRLLGRLQKILNDGGDEWEATYFALICLEKISVPFNDLFERQTDIWPLIIDCLANKHPWVKLASSRIISKHLTSKDVETLLKESSKTFLLDVPGSLFQVARNFCYQINSEEDEQDDELTALATKSLTWVLKAAKQHPHLCFSAEEAADEATAEKKRNPILWIMTRLSNIARPRSTRRRQAVFKCFAAFATLCSDIVLPYLELMLEPLHRSEMEARNELEVPALMLKKRPAEDKISEESQLAKDLMHLLEEHCDSHDTFLGSYAAVKTKARDKKDRRKLEVKTEAIVDPEAAAKRRIQKQEGEKNRRKRRVDEHRVLRGGVAKRRHLED